MDMFELHRELIHYMSLPLYSFSFGHCTAANFARAQLLC